jgi:leukotriene-A4 hydrolase
MFSSARLRSLFALGACFGLLMGLSACTQSTQTPDKPAAFVVRANDDHSYARPLEARVRHVDLDLRADFARHVLKGKVTLTLETNANAKQVVLDTKALKIERITDAAGAPLSYTIGESDPILGSPLTIELPQGAQSVVVYYETTKDTEAVQWLTPAQTAGKRKPFLFTQGESILTRSWIPTQDSPMIRQTYKARILVPPGLTAVMSAKMLSPKSEPAESGYRAYRFEMDQPIAPYLIALAVGDLAFKPISDRTGVWAEPVVLKAAAEEFSDLENMVATAEKLYGPYRWERYDLLILPPSFPYGGMENPRLTFITPTVLAGDKSLTSLISHELAHSWSGNLVTNATWEDFWLNEGFTTYIENRIMEQLYGRDRALMLQSLGYRDLEEEVKNLNAEGKGNFTRLHPELKGLSPEEAFSDIPYEKGAAFLRLLEKTVGRKKLDIWLKGYFDRHAFQSLTTEAFVEDLQDNLLRHDPLLENQLKLKAWLYDAGIPSNIIVPQSDAFARVDETLKAYLSGTAPKTLNTTAWSTQEWQHFLQALPETITLEQMKTLDEAFGLSKAHNSEILFCWLEQAIAHRYEPAMPALKTFLSSQGRRKFVLPLYKDLMKQKGWGVEMAKTLYAANRAGYHQVTQTSVDAVVKQDAR